MLNNLCKLRNAIKYKFYIMYDYEIKNKIRFFFPFLYIVDHYMST